MVMIESDVYEVAKTAAFSYCKKFRAFKQFDDAISEAALFLLEHKTIWEKPRRTIVIRVVGALVRNYQNAHGARLKNRPLFYRDEYDFDNIALENTLDEKRLLVEWKKDVENTLKQREFEEYVDVIRDLISGLSVTAVAKKYRIPQRRIRNVFKRFKAVCVRLF